MAYELVGGVFARALGGGLLALTHLPPGGGAMTIEADAGVPVRDLALDPAQDLLVLVQTDSLLPLNL